MPRSSQTVDDRTPIAGSRLDIAARLGWLLRTHRTVGGFSLREMSAALRDQGVTLSPASLSRIESEGQLSPAALDGYAAVLGLPVGWLRAPAESVCESFRHVTIRPAALDRVSLAEFNRAYEAVTEGSPTGGDWLDFARQHLGPSGFGLPSRLMEQQLGRLAAETARSVTPARMTRRMAMTYLRRSAYGDLLATVADRTVADPASQGHWDVMDVLSARPTRGLVEWAGALLADDSTYTVVGSTFLLQSLLLKSGLGLDDWSGLVPQLERAWARAGGDAARRSALTTLCNALPPQLRSRLEQVCCPDRSSPPAPRTWSRDRANRHYVYAESLATEATTRGGHSDEPLLARLLFESFFDPRGVRMSNATVLVMASPFAAEVVRAILAHPDAAPDQASWAAALRVAAFCHVSGEVPGLDLLLGSTDDREFLHALSLAGRADRPLDDEVVARGLAGGELVVRRTLYCLGMQGDDVRLKEIEGDRGRADWVRGGARWWREQRGRLLQ